MEKENTFKIFNNTYFKVGILDRLRILFGAEVKVSVTIHTEQEVVVIPTMTESVVYVQKLIKRKAILMQSVELKKQ
jgi:hypothetical protein